MNTNQILNDAPAGAEYYCPRTDMYYKISDALDQEFQVFFWSSFSEWSPSVCRIDELQDTDMFIDLVDLRMDIVARNGNTGEHYGFMTPEEENEYFNQQPVVDNVNHPEHYQSDNGLECIDAIRAQMTSDQFAAYCQGNIVKYLWRWRQKAGVESLKKAQWYLERMIRELE